MTATDPFGTPRAPTKTTISPVKPARSISRDQMLVKNRSPPDAISFRTGSSRDPSNVPSEGSHQHLIFSAEHTKSPANTK